MIYHRARSLARFLALPLALILGIGIGAGPGAAGVAQERIFATGVLDTLTDEPLRYHHARALGITHESLRPVQDGQAEISIRTDSEDRREAMVVLREGVQERRFNPFPAQDGNPLLMIFMETAVHNMAAMTGGSPFYIRNRMREALRMQDDGQTQTFLLDGRELTGERFSFRPFAEDPNTERMGAFGALEIDFVISAHVPGHFVALLLTTGEVAPGQALLSESIILEGVELPGPATAQ